MKLTYKDNDGKELYGYSQISLENNNKILTVLVAIMAIWTVIVIWLIHYVMKNNVLNNIVAACV